MTIHIPSLNELKFAAGEFISTLGKHRVIAFSGEMGAGKTTFIKTLCEQLGIEEMASSPTYSLVNEYQTLKGEKIYHFDFYRLQKESEAHDMGCEEYFYSGSYCFIEWPEKIPNLLPLDCLQVQILVQGTSRELRFTN